MKRDNIKAGQMIVTEIEMYERIKLKADDILRCNAIDSTISGVSQSGGTAISKIDIDSRFAKEITDYIRAVQARCDKEIGKLNKTLEEL